MKDSLVAGIDANFGIYEGLSFRSERFERWLAEHRIPWPRSDTGRLVLDDDTFRIASTTHPRLTPLRELRRFMSQLRAPAIAIGRDGRNRCLLSAFRSQTGRNQPSNARFLFGAPSWMRGLIQPRPGMALAYLDWSQQEFGIAAALSEDAAMIEAYRSGDPYLAFAKQAGAVPDDATKASHGSVRDQFKQCVLGVQYGMGEETLALRIGRPRPYARELLDLHRRVYSRYWAWSRAVIDTAMLHGRLHTVFGWHLHVTPSTRSRSLANFPMQANGAEMLRLTCIRATEAGVHVCAPVHDAILVEAPAVSIETVVQHAQRAMARASEDVLGTLTLRTDARVVHHPGRLLEPRGEPMWGRVLAALESAERARRPADPVVHQRNRDVARVDHPSSLLSSYT